MDYEVTLRIDHHYASPAIGGRHLVCLAPLPHEPGQTVRAARVAISPPPSERIDRLDFFGNQVTEFAFRGPYAHVTLTMTAQVSRHKPAQVMPGRALMAELSGAIDLCRDVSPASPLHFLSPSTRVPRDPEILNFARELDLPGPFVQDLVRGVGRALHDHMTFDASATTVDTPAAEAFAKRRGVCQDFSHIMIACLRGLGIPSGYVSGFLRTLPPKGKPRLEGADAMHAWVQAWCGTDGWVDYDPTNACFAGEDHIVVARGRDYSDVAPVKGSMRISGGQRSKQAVDVVPV